MNVAGDAGDYSTCAGFFDADGDGDLDLIVGGYALWNQEVHAGVSQVVPGLGRVYSDPDVLEGQFGRIFRNEGAAGFTEQTDTWGFKVVDDATQKPIGKNLGFGFGYFNGDRILDVVVANDQVRNLFALRRRHLRRPSPRAWLCLRPTRQALGRDGHRCRPRLSDAGAPSGDGQLLRGDDLSLRQCGGGHVVY